MWRGLLVATWLLLAGCGDDRPGSPCYGSFRPVGLTDLEISSVRDAMAHFDTFARTRTTLTDDGVCEFSPKTAPEQVPVGALANTEPRGIWFDRDLLHAYTCDPGQLCYHGVILHELGHAYWMEHLPGGRVGIMSPVISAAEFTDADRQECERVELCSR